MKTRTLVRVGHAALVTGLALATQPVRAGDAARIVLELKMPSSGQAQLRITRLSGPVELSVQLQQTSHLLSGLWETISTMALGESGVVETNFAATAPHLLFRTATDGPVYSLNRVGWVKRFAVPGYSLFGYQFYRSNNTVAALFPALPDGCSIYKLGAGGFEANNFLGRWNRPEMQLLPGEGWFFRNPGTAPLDLTFFGEIAASSTGYCFPFTSAMLCSPIQPVGGELDDVFPVSPWSSGVSPKRIPWEAFCLWDSLAQVYRNPYPGTGWDPPPIVSEGESFWFYREMPSPWAGTEELSQCAVTYPTVRGRFLFANFFTYKPDPNFGRVLDWKGVPLTEAHFAQLYAATNSDESALQPIGPPVEFLSGYANAGEVAAIPALGWSTLTAYVQLRAWPKSAGTNYESARLTGASVGKSTIVSLEARGVSFGFPPTLPPLDVNTFPSFALDPPTRPELATARVRDGLHLSWPLTNYVLIEAPALSNGVVWTTVPLPYTTNGASIQKMVPITGASGFFRLEQR